MSEQTEQTKEQIKITTYMDGRKTIDIEPESKKIIKEFENIIGSFAWEGLKEIPQERLDDLLTWLYRDEKAQKKFNKYLQGQYSQKIVSNTEPKIFVTDSDDELPF